MNRNSWEGQNERVCSVHCPVEKQDSHVIQWFPDLFSPMEQPLLHVYKAITDENWLAASGIWLYTLIYVIYGDNVHWIATASLAVTYMAVAGCIWRVDISSAARLEWSERREAGFFARHKSGRVCGRGRRREDVSLASLQRNFPIIHEQTLTLKRWVWWILFLWSDCVYLETGKYSQNLSLAPLSLLMMLTSWIHDI